MQYYAAIWKVTKSEEKAVGMEPRWLPIEEIKSIFRMHQKYAETDELSIVICREKQRTFTN
jgi:hypothetical protein